MKSIVVGTAGHIDHGKSALVRALTGTDPDRLKEEQARGITIDLGFAHLEHEGVTFAFVDVPGHERFVKNMLAGAGGTDLVMLVVSAEESVMPQTREHFQICRLLRVPAGIIVLTKADLADPAMLEISGLETREMVAGSFLEDAPIVAVSAKTGAGLEGLRRALAAAAASLPERDPHGPARLPIDRVFSVKGFGTVVTGTLVSGTIRADDELTVLPRNLPVKIRGLQVHGRHEGAAGAGQRVAANLGGIELADVARGDTLCTPWAFEPTRRLDAAIDLLADARALRHGARVRFHHGTTELLGRVAVAAPRHGDGGSAEVQPGRSAFVRIRLEGPAVITRGDRFILRSYSPSVTIGGGVVLDPAPPRSAIRTAAAAARFRRLDEAEEPDTADAAVLAFVGECGGAGLPRGRLISRAGLTGRDADATVARLARAGSAVVVEGLLVLPAVLEALSSGVLSALRSHHASQPLSEGIPREEVRERLFGRVAPAVFEHVLTELARAQKIVARDRLALAGHVVSLSPEEAAAQAMLDRIFSEGRLAPPDLATLPAAAGMPGPVIERVIKLLLRQKTLVKVDGLIFHASALAQLKVDVRGLKGVGGTGGRVDVSAFKERYGITRKFAIPLLEYLDRERVTRRVGDARVVL
jgi:selenocysteine-specific elongation factor